MKLSEMIAILQGYYDTKGDLEVLITDDWYANGYRGDYIIAPVDYGYGEGLCIEIDIKGCLTRDQDD